MAEDKAVTRVRKINLESKKAKLMARKKPDHTLVGAFDIIDVAGVELLSEKRQQDIMSVITSTLKESFREGSEAQDIMLLEGEKPEIKVKGSWMTLEHCKEWELEHFNYFLFNMSKLSTPTRDGIYRIGEEYVYRGNNSIKDSSVFKYEQEPRDLRTKQNEQNIPILDNKFFRSLMEQHGNSYDYSLTIGKSILRCHVYSIYGTGVRQERVGFAIRVVPQEIPKLPTLNLPNKLKDVIGHSSGLLLVSGKTGSGKSTTVASIVNRFNQSQDKRRVITVIEDPIEYIHKSDNARIIQRRLGDNVPTYERATDDSLRESSDIVVLGEIKSKEEIGNALRLAEVGKMVIATIHSNSVADTVDRFVGEFSNEQSQYRSRLLENLLGILHQNLVVYDGEQFPLSSLLLIENEQTRNVLRGNGFKREDISKLLSDENNYDWAVSQKDWFEEKVEEAEEIQRKIEQGEVNEAFISSSQRKLLSLLNEDSREKLINEYGISELADSVPTTEG